MYTVYLRTNKINGKKYVGQTKDFKMREKQWKTLSLKYANIFLNKDRIEFGLENFDVKILAEVETREEAWELEEKYIKELKTKYPDGYNRSDGGKNTNGLKHTLEEKQIMSKIKKDAHFVPKSAFKKGNKPWNYGVKNCFDDKTLEKMKNASKGKHYSQETEFKKGDPRFCGENHWLYGKHHTEEAKEKNRQAHLGKISKKRKPIVQLTLDGEFIKEYSCCKEAAKELGFKSDESVRKACVEKWRTSGGFKWMFKSDYEEKMLEDISSPST